VVAAHTELGYVGVDLRRAKGPLDGYRTVVAVRMEKDFADADHIAVAVLVLSVRTDHAAGLREVGHTDIAGRTAAAVVVHIEVEQAAVGHIGAAAHWNCSAEVEKALQAGQAWKLSVLALLGASKGLQ
jgi:hypothetical protein